NDGRGRAMRDRPIGVEGPRDHLVDLQDAWIELNSELQPATGHVGGQHHVDAEPITRLHDRGRRRPGDAGWGARGLLAESERWQKCNEEQRGNDARCVHGRTSTSRRRRRAYTTMPAAAMPPPTPASHS